MTAWLRSGNTTPGSKLRRSLYGDPATLTSSVTRPRVFRAPGEELDQIGRLSLNKDPGTGADPLLNTVRRRIRSLVWHFLRPPVREHEWTNERDPCDSDLPKLKPTSEVVYSSPRRTFQVNTWPDGMGAQADPPRMRSKPPWRSSESSLTFTGS